MSFADAMMGMIDDLFEMFTLCKGKWKTFSKNHVCNCRVQKFFICRTVLFASFGINAPLICVIWIQIAIVDCQATLLAIGFFGGRGILNDNCSLLADVGFGRRGLGGATVTHGFG